MAIPVTKSYASLQNLRSTHKVFPACESTAERRAQKNLSNFLESQGRLPFNAQAISRDMIEASQRTIESYGSMDGILNAWDIYCGNRTPPEAATFLAGANVLIPGFNGNALIGLIVQQHKYLSDERAFLQWYPFWSQGVSLKNKRQVVDKFIRDPSEYKSKLTPREIALFSDHIKGVLDFSQKNKLDDILDLLDRQLGLFSVKGPMGRHAFAAYKRIIRQGGDPLEADIHVSRHNINSIGCCGNLEVSLQDSIDMRRILYCYIHGALVGIVKCRGDPSMYALQNVVNSKGQLVLAAGGMYALNEHDLIREGKDKMFGESKKHVKLNVNGCKFLPLRFADLGNRKERALEAAKLRRSLEKETKEIYF